MNMLKLAKDAAPRSPVLHAVIEKQMLKLLAEPEEYEEYEDMLDPSSMGEPGAIETPGEMPEEDSVEEHTMMNPETGETRMVSSQMEHERLMAQGWIHPED
jgi:hypothetical protein